MNYLHVLQIFVFPCCNICCICCCYFHTFGVKVIKRKSYQCIFLHLECLPVQHVLTVLLVGMFVIPRQELPSKDNYICTTLSTYNTLNRCKTFTTCRNLCDPQAVFALPGQLSVLLELAGSLVCGGPIRGQHGGFPSCLHVPVPHASMSTCTCNYL